MADKAEWAALDELMVLANLHVQAPEFSERGDGRPTELDRDDRTDEPDGERNPREAAAAQEVLGERTDGHDGADEEEKAEGEIFPHGTGDGIPFAAYFCDPHEV